MKVFTLLAAGIACAAPLAAQVPAKTYDLQARYADAVVTIQAVMEVEASAAGNALPKKDLNAEGIGTLVDSDGWAISALSTFDPSAAFEGRLVPDGKGHNVKLEARVAAYKDMKLILPGGEEVKAELVLKDEDLDLAVFHADPDEWKAKSGAKLPAVDLNRAGEGRVLDEFLALGRSNLLFDRKPLATEAGILMKLDKPRTLYHPSFIQKGGVAMLFDGRVLGIGAQRVYQKHLANAVVIVPAAAAAELLRQAKAGKP